MLDFGEADKMIKIKGKMDKTDTYKGLSSDISSFIQEFLLTLSVLSIFPFIFLSYIYIYIYIYIVVHEASLCASDYMIFNMIL